MFFWKDINTKVSKLYQTTVTSQTIKSKKLEKYKGPSSIYSNWKLLINSLLEKISKF